jgi:DNA adenine methylase
VPEPSLRPKHAAKPRIAERAQPFLKWAGGKSAIAKQIAALLPKDLRSRVYREPFLGGGAMFFHLRPERAFLSDAVVDLIETYEAVRSEVEPLIERLGVLKETHSSQQFYNIRERFNAERKASRVERAAWLIYLNKTCFNGLFRTNKGGGFNVPEGRFKNPRVVDPVKIRAASRALVAAHIRCAPFEHLLEVAEPGDLIYFDPPYVPLSRTSSFAAYHDGSFDKDDQQRLADVFRRLDERGCLLALSNSDTPTVRRLYKGFDVKVIVAPRAISSKASTRGPTEEVLVRNTKRYR